MEDSKTGDIYCHTGARHKEPNTKQIRYHLSSWEVKKLIPIYKRLVFYFTKNAHLCITRVSQKKAKMPTLISTRGETNIEKSRWTNRK